MNQQAKIDAVMANNMSMEEQIREFGMFRIYDRHTGRLLRKAKFDENGEHHGSSKFWSLSGELICKLKFEHGERTSEYRNPKYFHR